MANTEQLQIIIDALYLAGDEFTKLQKDLGVAEKETKKTSKGMNILKKALQGATIAAAAVAIGAGVLASPNETSQIKLIIMTFLVKIVLIL